MCLIDKDGDGLMDIKQRLDKFRELLHDEGFLSNHRLGNEVGLYVFAYNPKDEMIVRYFIEDLKRDYASKTNGCRIIAYDLYDVLISICEDRRILDRLPQLEVQRGSEFLCQQIKRSAPPDRYIEKMMYESHEKGDVIILYGVGKVYPYMRSHNILNNIQQVFENIPVVMFYPGEYTGQSLTLFSKFKDDNYYRAFNLIERNK